MENETNTELEKQFNEGISQLKLKLKEMPKDQAEFHLVKLMYKLLFEEDPKDTPEEWRTKLYCSLSEMYVTLVTTGDFDV